MKFQKPENFKHWSEAKTKEQIDRVWKEIKVYNKILNSYDGRISAINEEKRIVGIKISNKHHYIKQLEAQLNEIQNNGEWVEA